MSNIAGERADYLGPDGYRYIDIDGETHRAERMVWLYVHGEYREDIIHINGDKADNRLVNLRPAETN